MSSEKKPWRAICEALEAEEVEYVFGLPGNPIALYNDLYDFPEIKAVLVRMETSAVFMAMAYARVTGKVGVLHASPGPGMANLLPGLLEAFYGVQPHRRHLLGRGAASMPGWAASRTRRRSSLRSR